MISKKIKNLLSLLLRFGLSVLLLAYLFSKINKEQMLDIIKNVDIGYLALALVIFILINLLLLVRWAIFIHALKLRVPLVSVIACFFIGLFFNLFLPSSTGGDLAKALLLFRDTSEKAKVVATVVLDRLSGFVGIVLVALIAFVFGYRYIADISLLTSIMALAGISAGIIVVLFNERLYEFFCRVFNYIPAVKEKLMQLHYAIVLIKKQKTHILITIGISCFCQIIYAGVFYLVALALHHRVGLIYFLIFVPLICVVSSLPSIGGLGVRDAGSAYLLAKVGVSTATAVSISLLNFLFMVIVGLMGGLIYVGALSFRRVQCCQDDTSPGSQES